MARGLKKAPVAAASRPARKRKPIDVASSLKAVNAKLCKDRQKRQRLDAKAARPSGAAVGSAPSARPKPGDACPWWRPELTDVYSSAPREQPGAIATPTTLAGRSTSWFSVERLPLQSATDTSLRPQMAFAAEDVWSQEAGADRKAAAARKGKTLEPVPLKQLRCRAMRIRFVGQPTAGNQQRMMRKWMGAHRFTYNQAVALVRQDKRWLAAEGQYLNEHLVYASKNGHTSKANASSTAEQKALAADHQANMDLRRKALGVQVGSLVQTHPWLLEVPSYLRKNAVRDVLKAEKSNEGIRQANPRHKWSLKYKSRGNPSAWTIGVSKECITRVAVAPRPTHRPLSDAERCVSPSLRLFPEHPEKRRNWTRFELCPTYKMGTLWLNEEIPGGAITKDCKLTVDGRGRFYLVVPYEVEPTPPTTKPPEQRKVGAVDPGDRIQATVYSPHDGEVVQYAVGKKLGGKDRVFLACKAIDDTIVEANAIGDTAKKRAWYRRRLAALRARVRALVTEARNKIALDMSRRWDTLILPPFETGGMVKRKQRNGLPRKLHSKVARSLMSWRHYDFGVHVKNVFLRAGKEVVSPDERYTTMNCGVCGVLNDKHSNEQWTCKHCGAFHLRDPAASRCIFLKALVSAQQSNGDAVHCGEIQPNYHQAHDASSTQSDSGLPGEDVRV